MALSLQVPIHVSPEAEAYVEELGLGRELDLMLEHTRSVVPGVRSVAVTLDINREGGDDIVLIWAEIKDPGPDVARMADERPEVRWDEWVIDTFSPDVHRHFCMMLRHLAGDDGR